MERVLLSPNEKGIEIPWFLMERYGLQPNSNITLELREDGILILPALPGKEEIENLALQYTFVNLGDAVTVWTERQADYWQVALFGASFVEPAGYLAYSLTGHFLPHRSTSIEQMQL
jgi:antitoxin component of MazEF toxin-antitoxin module